MAKPAIGRSTRCFTTEQTIGLLLRFREIGVKGVHVLGSSRLDLLALLAYMARNDYFASISFDSTSVLAAARKGKFLVPQDLGEERINDFSAMKELEKIACTCDLCVNKLHTELHRMDRTEGRRLLISHNYEAIMDMKTALYDNSNDIASVRKFLQENVVRSKRLPYINRIFEYLTGIEQGDYVV